MKVGRDYAWWVSYSWTYEWLEAKSGICQQGMIDEPVQKGFEVLNAINHFIKASESDIDWEYYTNTFCCGRLKDTTKLISVLM